MWIETTKELLLYIEENSKVIPVFVVFGFRTSNLTKQVITILETTENNEKYKYICVDIEDHKDLIETYSIRTSPCVILFKNSVVENVLKMPITTELMKCLI